MCEAEEKVEQLEHELGELEAEFSEYLKKDAALSTSITTWHDLYVMRTGDLYGLSKLDRDDVETLLKIIEEARKV